MFYATIDCGTTNSRAYIIDEAGRLYGKGTKPVGVRDTAVTGSNAALREGLREIIYEAAQSADIQMRDIRLVMSSGMITSEIGLKEIPHLSAPCDIEDLAKSILKTNDTGIVDKDIPVYFVRGIKNNVNTGQMPATEAVGELDFMRGEETQIMGTLESIDVRPPVTIVILSSHTKFVPVDSSGAILGSLTTLSGQLYDAVVNHTFISKSVDKQHYEPIPEGYFDKRIVSDAIQWIRKAGLVRSLMFPRFMDVLLKTKWYERMLFLESMIAAEDLLAMGQMNMFGETFCSDFILIGQVDRCNLYRYIIGEQYPDARIYEISKTEDIDMLSIKGILAIARKAGITP